MTQPELEALFSPFGRIITSRILCDNLTGKIKINIRREKEILSVGEKWGGL